MQYIEEAVKTLTYLFGLSPALEDKNVGINIFNTNPAGERQRGVSPNPVHHGPQLCQEGNHPKAGRGGKTRIQGLYNIQIYV